MEKPRLWKEKNVHWASHGLETFILNWLFAINGRILKDQGITLNTGETLKILSNYS